MKAIQLLSIISVIFLSFQAQANIFDVDGQDRTEILLDETHFNGQNLIHIRNQVAQKLKAQGLNIKDYSLAGVTLRAKSFKGNGKATLIVGQDSSTRNVGESISPLGNIFGDFGSNIAWMDKGGKTFHKIVWDLGNNPGTNQEVWQIQFNGNIKVDFMEVHLQSSLEKVRINLKDEIYGSAPNAVADKVQLKKELQDLGYKPAQFALRAVRVIGKSAQGKGKAELVVGNKSYGALKLDDAKPGYSFQDTDAKSYDRAEWTTVNETAPNNAWQVRFNGRNRVKAVVVVLEAL